MSIFPNMATAQVYSIQGKVIAEGKALPFAQIHVKETHQYTSTDSLGSFTIKGLSNQLYTIDIAHIGYERVKKITKASQYIQDTIQIQLTPTNALLNEIVVTGTMREVLKSASPVSIEIYNAKFFKANPSCSVFDALQNINGVRPQLNCNICNTGDIHINGLEGPYTMILIDGMPIVSGLSTIYGLSGIPQSLIERVEIIKGPASTLYGSEAVGGLVNIITKKTFQAPIFSLDLFNTSWNELNIDIASKFKLKKMTSYIGVNLYDYNKAIDKNQDNFTDVTLQKRGSIFNKWDVERKQNRVLTIAGRYVIEDRWGGEMNWNKQYRGGDSIYAENIITNRWELLSNYQLPTKEKIFFKSSLTNHYQNSVYGKLSFIAKQFIGFGQLTWDKTITNHALLLGASVRYTYYDDNTVVTSIDDHTNLPSKIILPGLFFQDEFTLSNSLTLLSGIRYDYNSLHGNIVSPRLNIKWNSFDQQSILRVGIGNGYRVANIYSEDHAALTGSRKVAFLANIQPETSWNLHVNFQQKWTLQNNSHLGLDATAFYTYFTNKIIADYLTDPNKILYDNLHGYAISNGLSFNLDYSGHHLKAILGGTLLDVYSMKDHIKTRQLFTEKFTGTWTINYQWQAANLVVDYSGNVYSPMRLPLLGALDPRKANSPWWSIQNIQFTKKYQNNLELYMGIKNILNWTPNIGNPFIIARANDPFDKQVIFDQNGQALATPNNPYGLTFDPSYVYGPNQGIKLFVGIRYAIK